MRAAERGVLLLCCTLCEPDVKPLTLAQFRELSGRAVRFGMPGDDPLRNVSEKDLQRLGYDPDEAERIVHLLSREAALDRYLAGMERAGIFVLTRISPGYPPVLSQKLGLSCPPALFCKGDPKLLQLRALSVVGSRKLTDAGRAFARSAGRLIAQSGFSLCSGGAVGADSAAYEAAMRAGGSAVIFTPMKLWQVPACERTLFVSEDGYDVPFSSQRALRRNRLIHAFGEKTLVAQTGFSAGGTWSGTVQNLREGYSPVFVHDDGSEGARALMARGAFGIKTLSSISALEGDQLHF